MEKEIIKDASQEAATTPVRVTVFTPTFNRKQTLERTYISLKKQSFRDFEWLIIDDGSTDDTESLVAGWLKEKNSFPIRYYWKPNGGKHTAHNCALPLARGEYFAILDSDDWYDPEALMVLMGQWDSMPETEKQRFSNIEGICRYADGSAIGRLFPCDIYESDNFSIRKLHDRPMDTMGMYRLDILKEFTFPENFEGCFVPESLVWDRIADKYKTLFLNKTIGYKEYLPGGLTMRSLAAGFRRSEPAVLYYRELSRRPVGIIQKIKCGLNVFRYSFHNELSIRKQLNEERSKALNLLFVILGYLAYLKDKRAISREASKSHCDALSQKHV